MHGDVGSDQTRQDLTRCEAICVLNQQHSLSIVFRHLELWLKDRHARANELQLISQ